MLLHTSLQPWVLLLPLHLYIAFLSCRRFKNCPKTYQFYCCLQGRDLINSLENPSQFSFCRVLGKLSAASEALELFICRFRRQHCTGLDSVHIQLVFFSIIWIRKNIFKRLYFADIYGISPPQTQKTLLITIVKRTCQVLTLRVLQLTHYEV